MFCGTTLRVRAQNIAEIAKSDPLVISGAVGTQNTYHYITGGQGYASPLSNSVYANLNISLYGFSMPFSLYYSNDNLDFNYPQLSFNLTPTYKSWTGHLGQSSMSMSSYVMNMSFNGVGIEYNDGKYLRGGLFYGRLRKAINDDPTNPLARSPQYKRMGWGVKAGVGNSKNYLDFYLLRAYDVERTLHEKWRQHTSPQENVVVGVKGCVTPAKWMSFTANAATSVFSSDTRAEQVVTNTDFDKVFDIRYSTLLRFAGDANLNLMFRNFHTSLSYRLIQPDYTSLGCHYLSSNYHSLGIMASGTLFRHINLSGSFNGQADNLTKEQLYTTQGFVYNASASTRIGQHINIVATYNGYLQNTTDGKLRVTDSTRVHRQMDSYSLTPSASFEGKFLNHTASLSANYTTNRDLSLTADGHSDVETMALGASYGVDIVKWGVNVIGSFSHQNSKGYKTKYRSDIGSLTLGRSFLAEKNLNVSATMQLIYNEVWRQSKSLSMGCNFSAGYTLKQAHVFSAMASFNKYGDVNITKTQSKLDMTDISVSLNYAYTLPVLTIKSRAHRRQEQEEKAKKLMEKAEKQLPPARAVNNRYMSAKF